MTKRATSRVRRPLTASFGSRAWPGLVALGLVLLQLVTALHFALIPHGFNAELSGFEHLRRGAAGLNRATERAPDRPTLVTGVPSCAPEACPIGFSGPVSALLAPPVAAGLVSFPVDRAPLAVTRVARSRTQLLLAAPKTSPPRVI